MVYRVLEFTHLYNFNTDILTCTVILTFMNSTAITLADMFVYLIRISFNRFYHCFVG